MREIIRERIRSRLADLNISAHRAEKIAGLKKSFISDLLKDTPKKSFAAEHLPSIASALECDVAFLIGDQEEPQMKRTLLHHGVLEAGVYRPAYTDLYPTGVIADQRYKLMIQGAFKMADDHALPVGIVKNADLTVLLMTENEDISTLRPGDLVVASHEKAGSVEFSVREAVDNGKKIILSLPSSTGAFSEKEYTKIIGRVIAASRSF